MACRGSGVRVPSAPPTRSPAQSAGLLLIRRRASWQRLADPGWHGGRFESANEADRVLATGESAFGQARWHHVLMTATDASTSTTTDLTATPHRGHREVRRAQLPPPPGGAGAGRRRVGHRRRRQALPRLPRGLLRPQLRPHQRAPRRGRARAARQAHADQPRVLQRPAQRLRRGARPPHRQGHDPADELRRRGRRDRHQGQPQVGLRGQGRARRPGHDHHDGGQLPRPHHDHRQLLRRRRRDLGLRALHHGLPRREVRRRRGHRLGHRRDDRRRALRADPG